MSFTFHLLHVSSSSQKDWNLLARYLIPPFLQPSLFQSPWRCRFHFRKYSTVLGNTILAKGWNPTTTRSYLQSTSPIKLSFPRFNRAIATALYGKHTPLERSSDATWMPTAPFFSAGIQAAISLPREIGQTGQTIFPWSWHTRRRSCDAISTKDRWIYERPMPGINPAT